MKLCECEAHAQMCPRFATMVAKVCGQTQHLCLICFMEALHFVSSSGYEVSEEFENARQL